MSGQVSGSTADYNFKNFPEFIDHDGFIKPKATLLQELNSRKGELQQLLSTVSGTAVADRLKRSGYSTEIITIDSKIQKIAYFHDIWCLVNLQDMITRYEAELKTVQAKVQAGIHEADDVTRMNQRAAQIPQLRAREAEYSAIARRTAGWYNYGASTAIGRGAASLYSYGSSFFSKWEKS